MRVTIRNADIGQGIVGIQLDRLLVRIKGLPCIVRCPLRPIKAPLQVLVVGIALLSRTWGAFLRVGRQLQLQGSKHFVRNFILKGQDIGGFLRILLRPHLRVSFNIDKAHLHHECVASQQYLPGQDRLDVEFPCGLLQIDVCAPMTERLLLLSQSQLWKL